MEVINIKGQLYYINDQFLNYLKYTNRQIKDFYCRSCGKFMLPQKFMQQFHLTTKDMLLYFKRNGHNSWQTNIAFDKGDKNLMYLILPKYFDDQHILYRHTCWDCYLKKSWYKPYKYTKNWKNQIPSYGKIRDDFSLIFDISTEQIQKITKQKYTTNSLEHFQQKYGQEKGKEKYQQYKQRQAYTASSEYFLKEKGMTEEEVKQYHLSRHHTLQSDIQKYGQEQGTKKWKEYCDRQAYAGVTLEYYVQKYGQKEGIEKYYQMLQKKNTLYSYSPISQQLFEQIKNEESLFGKNEYLMVDKNNNKCYYFDFYNPSTKKVIEFNGIFWHAKPTIYKADDTLKFGNYFQKTAKEIWLKDKQKIDFIKQQGYDVKVVWQDQYRQEPQKIINECKDFLYK